jgi:outer membrane immunogenic protein
MLRQWGIATSVVAAMAGGTCSAASAAEPASWSGSYIGITLGSAWSDVGKSLRTPGDPSAPFFVVGDADVINAVGKLGWDETEVSLGGAIGYNFQFGRMLVGAELDISRLGATGRSSLTEPTPFAGDVSMTSTVKTNGLMTLRARLGMISGRSLFYVTGGLAYSKVSFSQTTTFSGVPTADEASDSSHQFGWTVGAGAEFAIDRHWTLKAEYVHADLGSFRTITNPTSPYGFDTVPFTHSVDLTAQIARVGLNYRF